MQEGFLAMIADDLFAGGDSVTDITNNWSRVRQCIQECNLTLSASKTVTCPLRIVILGWKWCMRFLSPTTHQVPALASVDPRKTGSAMRSFIGAFKAISHHIPSYVLLLPPMEDSTKGLTGAVVTQVLTN